MIVFDTSAWIEYFQGTTLGKKVESYLNTKEEIITPSICIAELKHKLLKDNIKEKEIAYTLDYMFTRSKIITLTADIALLSADNKVKFKLYLIDAIIYSTMQYLNSKLLTKDHHFKDLENVEFLE